jgi:PAS domain S-box-containing protein
MSRLDQSGDTTMTGTDVIAADHARLLALMDKVETANARGQRRTVARLLGRFVEAFDQHFEDERRLLGGLGVVDLDRRHSEYITARAWVLSHPIDPNDGEQVGRLVQYVRAWLTDHIVRQDGDVAEAMRRRDPSSGKRLGIRLDRIPLRWRLTALAVIPLLIVFGLAALSTQSLISEQHAAATLRAVTDIDTSLGTLVAHLQEETNRSIMIVGAPRRDRDELAQRFAGTDAAIATYRAAAVALRSELGDRAVLDALDNAEASLDLIWRARADVQIGSYDIYSTIEYYQTAVTDLMAVLPVVSRVLVPSEIAARLSAYTFLVRLNERAGAERNLGTSLLSGVMVNVLQQNPRNVANFATEQETLARTFAAGIDERFARAVTDAASVSPMLNHMRHALGDGDRQTLTARDWADATALRIERLRAVEAKLVEEIRADVVAASARSWTNAMLIGGGILFAILVSAGMTILLAWSILPPLNRIGAAIRRLADGDRIGDLPDSAGQGEIATLARNVVLLRNRLIQGDLLEAQRGTENANRLRTTLDSLPGIVFRIAQPSGCPPRVVAASSRLFRLTGLREKDVIDRPLSSVLRVALEPDDRLSLALLLRRIGLGPVDFECRLRRPDAGEPRWVRVLATPVQTNQGCLWDGVALDITATKRAELERRRLQDELDRLHRTQNATRFAAGLGDELERLAEPLRRTADDLLAGLPGDSALREGAQLVRSVALKVRRLAQRVDQSVPQGRAPVAIDLIGELERRVRDLRAELTHGVALEVDLAGHGHAVAFRGDAGESLVSCLAAYIGETLGDESGTVVVKSCLARLGVSRRRHLHVTVADARSPLARHALANVLRPPSSQAASYRRDELTLALVRALVEDAGGWIQASQQRDGSSIIEIFLPVAEDTTDNIVPFRGVAQ